MLTLNAFVHDPMFLPILVVSSALVSFFYVAYKVFYSEAQVMTRVTIYERSTANCARSEETLLYALRDRGAQVRSIPAVGNGSTARMIRMKRCLMWDLGKKVPTLLKELGLTEEIDVDAEEIWS